MAYCNYITNGDDMNNKCLNCAGYCDGDFCCEECECEYNEAEEAEYERDNKEDKK